MRLLRFALPSLLVLGSMALTGCGGFQGAAPLPIAGAQVNPGAIKGTVFGGHLPIAGAHVFIFEAQANGYGGQVVSRLDASTPAVAQDYTGSNTSNPTFGDYFITTDSSGDFTFTGSNYSCTSGNPVYLYAQGGSTMAGTATAASVSGVTVAAATTDASGASFQTVTITVSMPVSLAAGTQVTFTGFTGITGSVSSSVTTATSASTTFVVTAPTQFPLPAGSYNTGDFGAAATANFFQTSAAANPQIVNLAMLGLCPGTSGEFDSSLPFVVMNEVSTVAMAEAMSGFATTPTGTATNAVHIGASTTNLLGLQNAAVNASQLFNITGNGPIGPFTNGGDAHLANLVTPAGNGSVPQALMDTIANILAACVDDSNTYNPFGYNANSPATFGAGTSATATCTPLFETATNTGVPTTSIAATATATDTGTAAINIAHFPAGTPSTLRDATPFTYDTTFVSTLFPLQALNTDTSGVANKPPFVPGLTTAPNDFTVAIQYAAAKGTYTTANANLTAPESIAIDASGNAWVNSGDYVLEMNPLGVITYTSPSAGHTYGYVSIDPSGNVWTGNEGATSSETEFAPGAAGTAAITTHNGPYIGGLYDAMSTVTDGSGYVYIGAANPLITNQSTVVKLTGATSSTLNALPFDAGDPIAHGAIDSSGYVWETVESPSAIGRFSTTAGLESFPDIYKGKGNGLDDPEMPAIDATGTMWVANSHIGNQEGALMRVTTAGATNTFTGGDQDNPYGTAIDGTNHIWMTSQCSSNCKDGTTSTTGPFSSILEFNDSGDVLSPAYNLTMGDQISHPLNIAVDASGVLWVTSKVDGMVAQVFGPGAPTYTPLSKAAGTSNLATRP